MSIGILTVVVFNPFFAYEIRPMYKILFVCTGNICRSPTAEGALRHAIASRGLEKLMHVDSAGTHGYHIGEAPDRRSIAVAKKRGIEIGSLKARKVTPADFHEFDLILGLDTEHLLHLKRMSPKDAKAETALFLDYVGHDEKDVPDPYYSDNAHFEYVLDLIEAGVEPLIDKIQKKIPVC